MRIKKLYIAIGMILAFGLFFELAANASENERTKITFSAPVQIPGKVLAAGTYIFEEGDPDANLNIIRIFSADGTVLEATLTTLPTELTEPTGDTTIMLAKAQDGPDYLVKWFYPGRTTGHEFVYTDKQQKEIAQAPEQTFVGSQPVSQADVTGE